MLPIKKVPDFTIPAILDTEPQPERSGWFSSSAPTEARFTTSSPYFSAGVYGLVQPEDVQISHSQVLYSRARLVDKELAVQTVSGARVVLDTYYSAITSMRHNEVRLRYFFAKGEIPGPYECYMERPYAREKDEPYIILSTMSALRRNNVPEIVRAAKKLAPEEVYFKLLEIPLVPTKPITKGDSPPALVKDPSFTFSGVTMSTDITANILGSLDSWGSLYNIMQVNKSLYSLTLGSESDRLWTLLCFKLLGGGKDFPTEHVRSHVKGLLSSKLVLGMKIKEREEDIEFLVLEIKLPGTHVAYSYGFPDWKADEKRSIAFRKANPFHLD